MEFDALVAGVEPGGLTNRTDIKVLLCYIIKSIDEPISKMQLNEIMQEEGLANYFEVNQAIAQLISQGNLECVEEDSHQILKITQKGIEVADMLERDLPRTVREKAINSAIRVSTLARRKQENKVDVEETEGGYNVTFHLGDEKTELMKLTIFVVDKIQVETIKENFFNDPVKLYSGIIASLTV
ncbi:MAG: DUF4364 family protein [Clostridia bacterium]|nr:DUF4364 family protein [Clostridia bacterium]